MSLLLKVQLANVLSQLSPFSLSLSLWAVCVRYTAPPMMLLFIYFLPRFLSCTQVIPIVDHKVASDSHFSICTRNEGQI